jgi:hypothetical protein
MSEPWPEDRRQELALLLTTLRTARSIDSGSDCLQNIRRVIDSAKYLLEHDFVGLRPGFVAWLVQQAHGGSDGRP